MSENKYIPRKIIIKPYNIPNTDKWGVEVDENYSDGTNKFPSTSRFENRENAIEVVKQFYRKKYPNISEATFE